MAKAVRTVVRCMETHGSLVQLSQLTDDFSKCPQEALSQVVIYPLPNKTQSWQGRIKGTNPSEKVKTLQA